jgi:hypothetical protein
VASRGLGVIGMLAEEKKAAVGEAKGKKKGAKRTGSARKRAAHGTTCQWLYRVIEGGMSCTLPTLTLVVVWVSQGTVPTGMRSSPRFN